MNMNQHITSYAEYTKTIHKIPIFNHIIILLAIIFQFYLIVQFIRYLIQFNIKRIIIYVILTIINISILTDMTSTTFMLPRMYVIAPKATSLLCIIFQIITFLYFITMDVNDSDMKEMFNTILMMCPLCFIIFLLRKSYKLKDVAILIHKSKTLYINSSIIDEDDKMIHIYMGSKPCISYDIDNKIMKYLLSLKAIECEGIINEDNMKAAIKKQIENDLDWDFSIDINIKTNDLYSILNELCKNDSFAYYQRRIYDKKLKEGFEITKPQNFTIDNIAEIQVTNLMNKKIMEWTIEENTFQEYANNILEKCKNQTLTGEELNKFINTYLNILQYLNIYNENTNQINLISIMNSMDLLNNFITSCEICINLVKSLDNMDNDEDITDEDEDNVSNNKVNTNEDEYNVSDDKKNNEENADKDNVGDDKDTTDEDNVSDDKKNNEENADKDNVGDDKDTTDEYNVSNNEVNTNEDKDNVSDDKDSADEENAKNNKDSIKNDKDKTNKQLLNVMIVPF